MPTSDDESPNKSSSDLVDFRFEGSGFTGRVLAEAESRLELARGVAMEGVVRVRFLVGGGAMGVVRSMAAGEAASRSVLGEVRSTILAALDPRRGLLDAAVRFIGAGSRGMLSLTWSGEEGSNIIDCRRAVFAVLGRGGLLLRGCSEGDEKLPLSKAAM